MPRGEGAQGARRRNPHARTRRPVKGDSDGEGAGLGGAGPSQPRRRLARLQNHPPLGGAAQAPTADDSDDDDIVALQDAPAHMRPPRQMTPIVVPDDSGDESDGDNNVPVAGPSKRARSDSFEILSSPPPMKRATASMVNGRVRFTQSPPKDDGPVPGVKVDYLIPIVLEVVPDLCPDWARDNLQRIMNELQGKTNVPGQEAVDRVINMAFEMDKYPRTGEKNVPQEEEEEEEGDYRDANYRAQHRASVAYYHQSQGMLEMIFTTIPVGHIRTVFLNEGKARLVPTYLALHRHSTTADKPYKELKKARSAKGKGRAEDEAMAESRDISQHDFQKESAFLRKLMADATEKELRQLDDARAKEKSMAERTERRQNAIDQGRSMECGCCFDQEATEDLVSCPTGHLFCRDCVKSLAENKLGEQQTVISCMDMSGCDETFTDAILASVLSATTMSLYHRLRQMKELEAAAIDGLESCPYCPYALVIDNPDEKLFQCLNPECGKVTCRNCKRPDHIPKRCEEVDEDYRLNNRHVVEEAMSAALMRRCPKCGKPYLKESGCNKITCQTCGAVSCYICQKEIPEQYAHFDRAPGGKAQNGTCRLWDRPEDSGGDAERIRKARDEATERVKAAAAAEGQQLEDNDLDVAAPEAPPPPPAGGIPGYPDPRRMGVADFAALGDEARAMLDDVRRRHAQLAGLRANEMMERAQMDQDRLIQRIAAMQRDLAVPPLAIGAAPRQHAQYNPFGRLAAMYNHVPIEQRPRELIGAQIEALNRRQERVNAAMAGAGERRRPAAQNLGLAAVLDADLHARLAGMAGNAMAAAEALAPNAPPYARAAMAQAAVPQPPALGNRVRGAGAPIARAVPHVPQPRGPPQLPARRRVRLAVPRAHDNEHIDANDNDALGNILGVPLPRARQQRALPARPAHNVL